METLAQARRRLTAALSSAGKEPSALESRLLLEAATGLTSLALVNCADRHLGESPARLLGEFAARRLSSEPVTRIIGKSGFYGLDLYVGPDVLDPRADTEILVNAALAQLELLKISCPRILDLGTGSGAILCALLAARPDAVGVGVDISWSACALAHKNLAHCGFSRRSEVICGDWSHSLRTGCFDLIVSNPPYISHDEIISLDHEVSGHDPMLALDGGLDGLDAYRGIAGELKRLLRGAGAACLEFGWTQACDVAGILAEAGYPDVQILQDNGGRDRVANVLSS
jgi:release factor glutamine methyltransferase